MSPALQASKFGLFENSSREDLIVVFDSAQAAHDYVKQR
jgi:hypothetical protein